MFDVLFNKAFALDELKKYHEAIVCYDKALKIDPNHAYALNNKGLALDNLGRYNEAIEYYDKALMIDPNHALAKLNKQIAEKNLKGKKGWFGR